jgi:hypothetical protein
MKLGEEMLKRLNKIYTPSAMVDIDFKGYDLSLKTDEQGNAIQAFIGKRNEEGIIKGDRYARTLKYDREGKLIKDHWERKGKAS